MQNGNEPILDEVYLSEISGEDPEFECELVETFTSASPDLIESLARSVDLNDLKMAAHAAHTLKGSARSIGANPFAKLCEAAEHAGKEGRLDLVGKVLPDLRQAFSDLESASVEFRQRRAA